MNSEAFAAYFADGGQTPGNAARLAAADSKYLGADPSFVHNVQQAADAADAMPAVVAAARKVLAALDRMKSNPVDGLADELRVALDKVNS